ncbi:ABC transporter ATP-binding protein [Aureispira sp. CCB-QB1]|uniref:ABC transporter ATP-binding protein n=1 Tax=Aureispira sp. CCB-QB1 TaxID=1313421 RepID=UPI0006966ABA|nr:ABC transporter ATP-binding protein [Aureispira sp. CCB-QB1]
MSNIVLSVENLSKQYRIGEIGTGTLSNDLKRWWAQIRGKEDPFSLVGQINDRTQKAESDYVWALKDINFQVKEGSVLGIIGKNGAGKSTLLKLISRITSPTIGSVKIKGRIASLLEVGTGMHPEMTARENIYLNGAIMGMTKQEISRKFDEIVNFAGCALYVDTPVKRYSSGMRVRLGFAVAAFLEPEILIVDEVLAVGDAEFQKRAIGKMKEVSQGGGRTVLFVSHNMASVRNLCNEAIVLENGQIDFQGGTEESISYYLTKEKKLSKLSLESRTDRLGNGKLRITDIQCLRKDNQPSSIIASGDYLKLRFFYVKKESIEHPIIGITIWDKNENLLAAHSTQETGEIVKLDMERGYFEIEYPSLKLTGGTYYIKYLISNRGTQMEDLIDVMEKAIVLEVEPSDYYQSGIINRRRNCAIIDAQFVM